MGKSLADRLEGIATKAVSKALGGKVDKLPLSKQVQMTRRLMYARPNGVNITRARLLSDDGLPSDIKSLAKKGQTAEEIKAYYWECEEFRGFWEKELEMTEGMLDELIRTSV